MNTTEKYKEMIKEEISNCISEGNFFPTFTFEEMIYDFNPNDIEFLKKCIQRLELQQLLSSRWIRDIGEKVEELESSEETRKRNQLLKSLPNNS